MGRGTGDGERLDEGTGILDAGRAGVGLGFVRSTKEWADHCQEGPMAEQGGSRQPTQFWLPR